MEGVKKERLRWRDLVWGVKEGVDERLRIEEWGGVCQGRSGEGKIKW